MTDQTNASLIAEAREAAKRADWYMTGESPLLRALADALEAAEQERDEARKAAEDHVLDADAVHVRLSAELRAAEKRAEEAERLAEVRRETIREYERENEAWSVRAHTAERERDRLDEAFDRDLPWRYDEVEAQRNQLAAVVEKARAEEREKADREPSDAEELARLRLERLEAVEDFITRHYLDTQMGERVLAIVNGIEEVRRAD